jgi:hypothetical protein
MKKRTSLRTGSRTSLLARRPLIGGAALAMAAMMASPAQAAFHLWSIREIYSLNNGTLQYIEFFTSDFSQQFVGGQQIVSRNVGNTLQNTFTIPSNLPGDTANHSFLIATPGFQAVAGFTPDYVMPANFLFSSGGSLNFFGSPSQVTYAALPTDGTSARFFPGGVTGVSSPQNFAGQTISPVPEPGVLSLAALCGVSACFLLRRRSV